MSKFSKFVLDVLPTLKKGRYLVSYHGYSFTGSRESIFCFVGSDCVALQLLIPFDFD